MRITVSRVVEDAAFMTVGAGYSRSLPSAMPIYPLSHTSLMKPLFCLLLAAGILLFSAQLHAHTVPNLVIEAEFKADHSYTLRVNFDPRLFLSEKPTSLPPVAASWWTEQTETQRADTQKQALDYLRRSYELLFSGTPLAETAYSVQPMDGADSMPLSATTTEVHLLATLSGKLPESAQDLVIKLHPSANAALVLLTSLEGEKKAARPQVLFTGESSRPVPVR
jgi:hypothetical protein